MVSPMEPQLDVLPSTGLFWSNRRGHRLHLRHTRPPASTRKVTILWLHGYGFHANLQRMWTKVCHMSEALDAMVIACDLEGHGYSEGRQTIENCQHLVQDVVDLCRCLFSVSNETSNLGALMEETQAVEDFFLGGESFGGAIAFQTSLQCPLPQLKGLMLAAPLLAEPTRSPTLLSRGLRFAVQKMPGTVGHATVPQIFLPKQDGNQVFSDDLEVRDFNADRRGHTSGALGFHHLPMSATTAAALIDMLHSLPSKMAQLELPLLVLHDPQDAITPVAGSEMLMKLCKSSYKHLVLVPDGLHAPHFNRMDFCEPIIRHFMQAAAESAVQAITSLTAEGSGHSGHSPPPLAADRWPAENRVAPQVSFGFLAGHFLLVASPFLLLLGHSFTWFLAAVVLIYASLGSFFMLEALRFVLRLRRAYGRAQRRSEFFECQIRHLVCVAVCREPDSMILTTLKQLNESPSASRMRVVFAMEEVTDRPLERLELYRQHLGKVKQVVHHIHPAKETEVRGLCSRYVFTKVDSQISLPLNFFPELELSVQRHSGGPVVWQPLLAGLLNRDHSIGAMRALTAMRCFSYPGIFALNLMCVTCYSLPLQQYIKMGLHHPSYLGEDCMMLAQSTIAEARPAKLSMLPVVVAVAPPLDTSCCGAFREAVRQCSRWAGQVAEVSEFRWRYRAPGTMLSTSWWLLKYWFIRLVLVNGVGLFAFHLSLVQHLPTSTSLPEVEGMLLFWMDKVMLLVLVSLLLLMPCYEQLLSHFFVGAPPASVSQLPSTILSAPLAILTNTLVDLMAWHRFLWLGKAGIVIRQRKKIAIEVEAKKEEEGCDDTFYC